MLNLSICWSVQELRATCKLVGWENNLVSPAQRVPFNRFEVFVFNLVFLNNIDFEGFLKSFSKNKVACSGD